MADADTLTSPIKRVRTPQRMRNLELVLLVIACAINTSAIILVQLGAIGHIDWPVIQFALVPAALMFAVHIVLRIRARDADPLIVPIAAVLNGLGIAMIYRIDIAHEKTNALVPASQRVATDIGVRQIAWTALAVAIAIAIVWFLKNYRVLARYRYISMAVAIVLLVLPLVPGIGRKDVNANVWLQLGPLSFQPGEIAKIALAVFFAGYLVTARESLSLVGRKFLGIRFPRGRDLGPILVVWAMSMLVLVFQRDLGTSLLYFSLFLVMIYVATGRISWIILGLVLFVGGALAASQLLGYVNSRFDSWLNPFEARNYDAAGGSYQLVTGIFGMSRGGLIGTGLGMGRPDITPLANSDFIFTSLGEELGLIGVFAILALYLLFVSRGFRIGYASTDDFGRLLAVGLSFVIGIQVFIVIGGVTRVIPLTGLTTPFMAAGGSSLVANWIIVALLLRLSDVIRTDREAVSE